jgi:hypothetical protein
VLLGDDELQGRGRGFGLEAGATVVADRGGAVAPSGIGLDLANPVMKKNRRRSRHGRMAWSRKARARDQTIDGDSARMSTGKDSVAHWEGSRKLNEVGGGRKLAPECGRQRTRDGDVVPASVGEEKQRARMEEGGRLGFLGGSRSGLAWGGDKRRREWLARWCTDVDREHASCVTGCRRQQAKGKKVGLRAGVWQGPRRKKGHVQSFKELKREKE